MNRLRPVDERTMPPWLEALIASTDTQWSGVSIVTLGPRPGEAWPGMPAAVLHQYLQLQAIFLPPSQPTASQQPRSPYASEEQFLRWLAERVAEWAQEHAQTVTVVGPPVEVAKQHETSHRPEVPQHWVVRFACGANVYHAVLRNHGIDVTHRGVHTSEVHTVQALEAAHQRLDTLIAQGRAADSRRQGRSRVWQEYRASIVFLAVVAAIAVVIAIVAVA